jgi:hypothetical protein
MRLLAILLLFWAGLGCTDPEVFSLRPIGPQVAIVGEELQIELEILDLGGIVPRFSLFSPTIPDLMTRGNPPRFTVFGNRGAYLRWVPIVSDAGTHEVTVTASGADHAVSQTFQMIVTSGNAAPVFLRPLGAGLTLDLSRENCFRFNVEVQDTDTVAGTIELESPIIEGYRLIRTGDWSAEFEWCPTADQISIRTRYDLNLVADDSDGHSTRKSFSLLLRDTIGDNCEGRAPRVDHMAPSSANRERSIEFTARITDDIGIETEPILYYREASTPSMDPRALETFSNNTMSLRSGEPQDGLYVATVPLAFLSPTTSQIEYFIEVTDNDDPVGNCDHRVTIPTDGVNRIEISTEPINATQQVCDRCTVDGECLSNFCSALSGDTGVCFDPCGAQTSDPCLNNPRGGCCDDTLFTCVNGRAEQRACAGPCGWNSQQDQYSCEPTHPSDPSGVFPNQCIQTGGCPTGYQCSQAPLVSKGGRVERACEPIQGSCSSFCDDDGYEPNDSISQASLLDRPTMFIDNLKICGNEDSSSFDYFNLFLETPGNLTVRTLFSHNQGDLDLSVIDTQDELVSLSFSTSDNEEINTCLAAGTYSINAFSFSALVEIDYSLDVSFTPAECCDPDRFEPNDSINSAPLIFSGEFTDFLRICQDDIDIYLIDLVAGDRLVVDLAFDQFEDGEDLDVFIHDLNNQPLTPCCDVTNGQSLTSDEHLEFPVPTSGRYAIVVEGYAGARNQYLMGVEIQ